jgi:hypothetical protein
MDFFELLWQNRNELLHQQKNNHKTAKNAALTEQLMWYQSNPHTLLAHHDHALLHNIDMSTLHTMPSRHKREWIRHLTTATIANTQELALKKTNQHSLIRYMKPVNAQPTANPGTQPPPHMHNRVHSRYRTQTGKTLARRQWLLQGIPRQPKHSLYAHHSRTRQPNKRGAHGLSRETRGGILVPMHPFPD